MISHYPRFREGAAPGLVPKLGGLPWGLPPAKWPVCTECGRPMSHLAQLPADPPALPLPSDEVLFIFKCEWDSVCSFWERDGGANAVFTVTRSALGDHEAALPSGKDGAPPRLRELGIEGFREGDDGTPPELEMHFYDYGLYAALPEATAHPNGWESPWLTKCGGVPNWTGNGPQQVPPGRMLLQLDNWVQVDAEDVAIANFCSDGIAFVFVDPSDDPLTYTMVINR